MSLTIEIGLRRGEMCGLKWSNIDFDNKTLSCNNALIRYNYPFKKRDFNESYSGKIRSFFDADCIIYIRSRNKRNEY